MCHVSSLLSGANRDAKLWGNSHIPKLPQHRVWNKAENKSESQYGVLRFHTAPQDMAEYIACLAGLPAENIFRPGVMATRQPLELCILGSNPRGGTTFQAPPPRRFLGIKVRLPPICAIDWIRGFSSLPKTPKRPAGEKQLERSGQRTSSRYRPRRRRRHPNEIGEAENHA